MADIYDEDEENPPIGFEQDPEEDELGIGTWKYADGSSRYSKGDAEDAKALLKKAPLASAGAALAGGDFAGEKRPSATRADAGTAAAGLAGERSPEESFLASTTGAEADEPGIGSTEEAFNRARSGEAPKAIGGAAPEPAGAPTAGAQPAPQGQPLQAPRLPGASGPARYTDTTGQSQTQSATTNAQTSVSRTGSAQDEGQFNQQQQNIRDSYGAQKTAQDEGSAGVANAIQQRRGELMQLAQDREAATTAAMAQRDARAGQVKQKIGEVSSRKTDHNKIWKDKGALGTTLGLLGVALRSLTATKFGGPNTALQSVQEQKKQNIQAQMEDRDSELRGLERELGSLDAAVPMLEARMNDALSKRLEAMTLDEKSATVLANAKQMKAAFDTERDLKLAEASKAYYGTLAQQQSMGTQQSSQESVESGRSRLSGAGVGGEAKGKSATELYADLLELDKKEEERGVPKEDRARKWQAYGFKPPAGESAPESMNREQREKVAREESSLSEDQAKAEAAMDLLDQFGQDSGLEKDEDDNFVEPGFLAGTVKPGWKEQVTGPLGMATPVSDSRKTAAQAVGRLVSGGVIGEDEGKEIVSLIGDEDASKAQIVSRLNRVKMLVKSRRKANRRDAPTGPRGRPIQREAPSR